MWSFIINWKKCDKQKNEKITDGVDKVFSQDFVPGMFQICNDNTVLFMCELLNERVSVQSVQGCGRSQ